MSIAIAQAVRQKSDRLFFTGMALASALTLYLGFLPSYFRRSAELPSLTPLALAWLYRSRRSDVMAGRRAVIHANSLPSRSATSLCLVPWSAWPSCRERGRKRIRG
jgi:hypothetical protein